MRSIPLYVAALISLLLQMLPGGLPAHDHSARKAEQRRRESTRLALAQSETPQQNGTVPQCQLHLQLQDSATARPLPGLIRITNLVSGKAITLPSEIHRDLNWYSIKPEVTVTVPAGRLQIEALHGLETERLVESIDLSGRQKHSATLRLKRIDNPRERNLRSGNTHLHLMKLSYLEALNYLEVVPQSDGLDLVYLSHLRRIPDERDYVSNEIVERSFAGGDLQRLSQQGVLFDNGQEHRHNFGRGGEGFGHVMLLHLQRLIHPVSIGPGIMAEGTDSQPLQVGIQQARHDGATVIWCHNTFGLEDLPNWAMGLLHAQNIFDGGEHGSYQDTYYRYLNLGWRVPFSTGTDWFIYDFSRVYVPVPETLTSSKWLAALREGKSFITNGPLLELTVYEHSPGSTLALQQPTTVVVRGRGIGRHAFRRLELIQNGEMLHSADCQATAGHFAAEFQLRVRLDQPGWLALRIPVDAGKNEFDRPLFAHTSPVYIEVNGRRIFRQEVARQLVSEMENDRAKILETAKFGNQAERESVERVYSQGLSALREQMTQAARPQ